MKLRPVDFASEGLFLCGTAQGPKTIPESIAQAKAAAIPSAALRVGMTSTDTRGVSEAAWPAAVKAQPSEQWPAQGLAPSPAPVVPVPGSELGVARHARKRNHVADVGHAGHVLHESLEAEPETRVRHGPKATQVQVPPVIGRVQIQVLHLLLQDFEPLLALAAADQFAQRAVDDLGPCVLDVGEPGGRGGDARFHLGARRGRSQ